MGKHVQIREVPPDMHRELKAVAAESGVSMSDYVKQIVTRDLERRAKWKKIEALIASMPVLELEETSVEMIRRERDSR